MTVSLVREIMNNHFKYLCTLVFSVLIISCGNEELSEKLIPKEESKFAEDYITKLRDKDFEYVKSIMSPELLAQINDELLLKMSQYFRKGQLQSTEIIGSQIHIFNGKWQGNFSFEYKFTSGWNLANTVLRKVNGSYEVIGLNVYQTNASQREINAFNLSSKSFAHYLILLMAIVVPLFIVVTTYYCARTPIHKRKWLWIIFILMGIGALKINWTTGQYAVQILSVHLLGASAMASGPHAPWIVSASIPLGAILFWFKRKEFIATNEKANKGIEEDAA